MNAHLTQVFWSLLVDIEVVDKNPGYVLATAHLLMMLFLVYAESMELWLLWFAFSVFTQCFVASVNTKEPIMWAEEPFLEPQTTHYLLSALTKYPNDSSVRRAICGDFC
jgi:hypothetical protein